MQCHQYVAGGVWSLVGARRRVGCCAESVRGRREVLSQLALVSALGATTEAAWAESVQGTTGPSGVDLSITQRVYLDIGLCPTALRADRAIGDKSALCTDPAPQGRIVIGLYGNFLPVTTANFVALASSGAYTGSVFDKVLPGEFVRAGRQGSHRYGNVEVPKDLLKSNSELLSGNAFALPHARPGTVSLCLSENDDPPAIRDAPGYRNAQFLITTGPGPVPSLDGQNIVFGRVLEGLDVVARVAQTPTFTPPQRVQAMNQLAEWVGDDRASKARRRWGAPLKAVLITEAGVLS